MSLARELSLSHSIRKKRGADSKRQSKYQAASPPKFQDDPLEQLSSDVLLQIKTDRDDDQVIPGKMAEVHSNETNSTSPFAFKSHSALPTTIVRGSFYRKAGIRESVNMPGSFVLRTVEIKRETGKSIGFYIAQGDGLQRTDGIFVSRISLGSVVDVNDLLHVGEEIVKVNGVDVSRLSLDDVVILMQNLHSKLILTVKIQTSATILRSFSRGKQKSPNQKRIDKDHPYTQLQGDVSSKIPEDYIPLASENEVHVAILDKENFVQPLDSTQEMEELHVKVVESFSNTKQTLTDTVAQLPLASSTPILASKKESITSQSLLDSPMSSSPPTLPTSPPPKMSSSCESSASLDSLSMSSSPVEQSTVQPSQFVSTESTNIPHSTLHESPSCSSSRRTSPPPLPHTPPPNFLLPPLTKPPPPPSDETDSEDDDIFNLKDIEQGLKNFIESDYDSS